jgi:hypothetical protein
MSDSAPPDTATVSAVDPPAPRWYGSAPCASSSSTIAGSGSAAAMISGVVCAARWFGSAPRSSRSRTAAGWRVCTAWRSGVQPLRVSRAAGSAPASSNARIASAAPWRAAHISGVTPPASRWSGSWWSKSRARTVSAALRAAAIASGSDGPPPQPSDPSSDSPMPAKSRTRGIPNPPESEGYRKLLCNVKNSSSTDPGRLKPDATPVLEAEA